MQPSYWSGLLSGSLGPSVEKAQRFRNKLQAPTHILHARHWVRVEERVCGKTWGQFSGSFSLAKEPDTHTSVGQ